MIAAVDPHPGWLAKRNRLMVEANAPGTQQDAADDRLSEITHLELLTIQTPATTAEGILAKTVLLAQIAYDGCEAHGAWIEDVLAEANAVTGMGALTDGPRADRSVDAEHEWSVLRAAYADRDQRQHDDWSVSDAAEQRLLQPGLTGPRAAAVLLKVALLHTQASWPNGYTAEAAILAGDISALRHPDNFDRLDWSAKFVVAALAALHDEGTKA